MTNIHFSSYWTSKQANKQSTFQSLNSLLYSTELHQNSSQ